jgi:hypothetical protein
MASTNNRQLPCFRLFLVAVLVSFGGSFHFGYQLAITNPSQPAFFEFVNSSFTHNYASSLTEAKLKVFFV